MLHEKRYELRGGLADQGTEKGLGDDSIRSVHGHEDDQSDDATSLFLFPRMLMMPGMLHILYNALQDAVESVAESKTKLFFSFRTLVLDFVAISTARMPP